MEDAATPLRGQVALVTGAGRGIGRAIAGRCAAAGARVGLAARSRDQLQDAVAAIRAAGGTALGLPTDVTDEAAMRRLVAAVEDELGPIDLMVNNAARFHAFGPVWEVDPAEWWADVTTNLRGVFLGCRAVVPGMLERNRGRILNLVGGGTANPFPNGSGYGSSKAAVMRLTECLAAELRAAGSSVAAFALSPGLVRTAMTELQLETPAGQQWMPQIATMFAAGRDVPPDRAAALAVALAGGRFDALAGRCFGVGDDLDDLLARQEEIIRKDQKTLRFR